MSTNPISLWEHYEDEARLDDRAPLDESLDWRERERREKCRETIQEDSDGDS